MGRRRSTAVYEAGPVRVTGRGPYRIRFYEQGVERERTARTIDDARSIADSTAARLELASTGAISGGAAFGALGDAWVERYSTTWSAGHTENIQSLLANHVMDQLGRIACDRVTDTQLQALVDVMVDGGYSADWVAQVVRAIRALCRWGVSRGVWPPHMNPAAELRVPKIDRLIDRTLVPTAAQVKRLAAAAEASTDDPVQGLRRRWMIRAAAGTGIRWGEMVVLTAADVDLDTREVSITKAWHPKEPADRRLGPPKSRHSVRTVIIPKEDVDLWRAVVDAAEPGDVLAKPVRGQVWAAPYWSNRVWPTLTGKVKGWPAGAGYHYLRHYAICGWVDTMHIGNASRLAGHHSAEFTMRRYVGASADYLDQARELL